MELNRLREKALYERHGFRVPQKNRVTRAWSLGENYHDAIESRRACPELVERGRLNFTPVQIRFSVGQFGQQRRGWGTRLSNEGHGFSRAVNGLRA
jgi:hypothetical protein